MQFFTARNLVDKVLTEGAPWDFCPSPELKDLFAKMAKPLRRQKMHEPLTKWQTYSAVRGVVPSMHVSNDNPPAGLRGLVVDYDAVMSVLEVERLVGEHLKPEWWPQHIEISLSRKIRLVWRFEREVLCAGSETASAVMNQLIDSLGLPTLLPGFDDASRKPSLRYTNGAEWLDLAPEPIKWGLLLPKLVDSLKRTNKDLKEEVPITVVADEVERRWPGKWQGEFTVDAVGIRFWDDKADNETGCQIKPDGILCFTGNEPFIKWSKLLGHEWYDKQRTLKLQKAAESVFFDGRNYWESLGGRWVTMARGDVLLALKTSGVSDKIPKGTTVSEADRVLRHIQTVNRVEGAAPWINYPPGIIDVRGTRFLNVSKLRPVQPVEGTGEPEKDFPWLWKFLNGFFARPESDPLPYFLSWLQRSHSMIVNHRKAMGQALFICGPKNNGKTLLSLKVIEPLMGGIHANPFSHFIGEDSFTEEMLGCALLAINDEEGISSEAIRLKFTAKVKSFVVNPTHAYHPKFCPKVTIEWCGRLVATLNDDSSSVGLLPEVNANTSDKMMYFASQEYAGKWGDVQETEETIKRELPLFSHWLLHKFKIPEKMNVGGRIGVDSYFDARILELSRQQYSSYGLVEALDVWRESGLFWNSDKAEFHGTPTELLTQMGSTDRLAGVMSREWTTSKLHKALIAIARMEQGGVTFSGDGERNFNIKKERTHK